MAEDAAGAVRRTPRSASVDRPPLQDRLIEHAAVPIAENQLRRYDKEFDARHLCAEDFMSDAREDARTLAELGLLADPGLRDELDEWREAAAAGGKEWLVTRIRAALDTPEGRSARMHAIEVRAERDALRARLAAIVETLGRAAGMMATDSRDWGRGRGDAWLYGLLVGWGCEELHQHDDACGGDAALREVTLLHAWSVDDLRRIRRFRAALQGDQPAGPPDVIEVHGELLDGRRIVGTVDLRPARELAARLAAEAAAEPTGEADRG